MKKLLNTILLLLAPLSLFATDQYTLGWNNPSTTYTVGNGASPVNIWGNTVWLTANETAGLSMSVVNVNNLNLSDYTLNYVVRAADGSYTLGTLGDLNGIGDTFSVGTVNATDSISFYVSSDAYGTYNAWVNGAGWVNTSIDYVIQSGQWSNGTVTVRIAATGSTPAGQPLPGVLTSLMLGGAIGGFYLRRKQKAA